jgi:hypothetical protein
MKPALFALVSLVLGIALGWVGTRTEFARDVLPVTSVSAGDAADSTRKGPRAVVANGERFEFGTMDRFAKSSHEFQIANEGDAPLEITLGPTTCKCTLSNLTKDKLAPGETTAVKLEWTVKTGEPEFEQSASITTNDPHHNPIHLSIHGHVIDSLRPEESQFTLNDLSANEATTVRLRVFAFKASELKVIDHHWIKPDHADHLQVSFEPLTRAELDSQKAVSGLAVVLKVQPGLPLGPISQVLKITFDLPDRDPLEIPLFGTVVSDVSLAGPGVTPSRLLVNLGTIQAGTTAKRTAYIMVKGPYRSETTLKLASVNPDHDFQATLGEPLRDNPKLDRYPLTIDIPATATPVARTGDENFAQIKFQVTHPQVKELLVKVRYIIKE